MENQIKIVKTFLKYSWKWKIKEDTCLICQQEYNTCCLKCKHPIECAPCIGECQHIFHLHCVTEWLQTSSNCPLCRSEWIIKKVFKFEEEDFLQNKEKN